MFERILVMVIVYGSILIYDRALLSSSSNKREKTVYFIFMITSLYFALSYALNLDFLGVYDLIDLTLTEPARVIDKWLTVPKE